MSWDVCTVTEPVARKDYNCEASDWIDNLIGWDLDEFKEEDRPVIERALREGCKILKGTRYVKIHGKWDGEFQTYRARKDLDAICQKYDLYEE